MMPSRRKEIETVIINCCCPGESYHLTLKVRTRAKQTTNNVQLQLWQKSTLNWRPINNKQNVEGSEKTGPPVRGVEKNRKSV